MIYDLNTKLALIENAKRLKKLFKGLGKKNIHLRDVLHWHQGCCHGAHHWSYANLTHDKWSVSCITCIKTLPPRIRKNFGQD